MPTGSDHSSTRLVIGARLDLGAPMRTGQRRQGRLVARLLDIERPVPVAHSGIQAVGYLPLPEGGAVVRQGWEGPGVDLQLEAHLR